MYRWVPFGCEIGNYFGGKGKLARKLWIALLGLPLVLSASAPAQSDDELLREISDLRERVESLEDGRADMLGVAWKQGLNFQADGWKGKIGGRIMLDFYDAKNVDTDLKAVDPDLWGSAAEFRRARIFTSGEIMPEGDVPVAYKLQFDFAGQDVTYKDLWMSLKKLPAVGQFKVGHFKEPFSLEEQTSSKYITFLERGMPNVFSPSRSLGAMLQNTALDDALHWSAGVFRGDFEDGRKSEWNATARLAGTPLYEDGGERLLHLGLSGSLRTPDDDTLRYRQRPEAHLAPRVVDTRNALGRDFGVTNYQLVGGEAAFVHGPFSAQAEYMFSNVKEDDPALDNDPLFHGGYVYASYFVTPGDGRAYKRSAAAFDKVKPQRNFGEDGWGALELAARYSHLDLNDGGIDGGEVQTMTLGANWYLNPNVRVMGNYTWADESDLGDADIFQARFQVFF